MKEGDPFIHIFKTPSLHYLYDVNSNRILKISKSLYNALAGNRSEELSAEDQSVIRKMKTQGLLSCKRLENIVHPANDYLDYYLQNKLGMVNLQVTQDCNLRCLYCAYSGSYKNRSHAKKSMSLETAKKTIDFYIANSCDTGRIPVGFYGGEPLLEFDLIKKCVAYTNMKAEGKKTSFNLSTNATILTDPIIEFFDENDVTIMISLDGPREIHDKNRRYGLGGCGSFDRIMDNLERIRSKFPGYLKKIGFNVTMDPRSDFTCLNNFFTNYETIRDHYLFFNAISSSYLKNDELIHESEAFRIQRAYEIFKTFLNKLGRLDNQYASPLVEELFLRLKSKIHDQLLPETGLPNKGHPGGPCIPGALRLFVSVDGTFYPCERVSEDSQMMKIGHVDRGFDVEKVRELLNIGRITAEDCKNCWAFRFCTLYAAAADEMTQLSPKKKRNRCAEVRNYLEISFKEYCTLKEFGYDFDDYHDEGNFKTV